MAEEYSAIFDEQLKAFEKERTSLKTEFAEKLEKLESQFKESKEKETKSTAELVVCQEHIKKTGKRIADRLKLFMLNKSINTGACPVIIFQLALGHDPMDGFDFGN